MDEVFQTEELLDMPGLDDDDGLPVVSLENKNLPVYARFPFDVTVNPNVDSILFFCSFLRLPIERKVKKDQMLMVTAERASERVD